LIPIRPRLREVVREKEVGFLLLLTAVFFHRPLFTSTFFFRDVYQVALPQRALVAEAWRHFRLPLWDPFLEGGQPLLANALNAALYPANLLYLALPTVTALNLELALHFALAGAAAYAAARVCGFSRPASLLAGLFFEFCGYTLSLGNLPTRLLALPFLPAAFLFWHLFLVERKPRYFAAAAFAGGLQVLASSPELNVLTFLFLLVWSLTSGGPLVRRSGEWLALVASVIALGAVQLLPLAEVVRQSPRGSGMSYDRFTSWSVHPKRLPELVLPGFLGRTDTMPQEDFWGERLETDGFPYVLSIYAGFPVLFLALAGVRRRQEDEFEAFSLVRRRALLCLTAGAVVFSLGSHLPFFPALHAAFPALAVARNPVKMLMLGLAPLALLAASGAERLFVRTGNHQPRRATVALPLGIAAALAGLAASIAWSPALTDAFCGFFFGQPSTPVARAGLVASILHGAAAAAGFGLLLAMRRSGQRGWHVWAAIALVGADLLWAGADVNAYAPRGIFQGEPPIVSTTRETAGEGFLFRDKDPARVNVVAPTPELFWVARWNFEVLGKTTAAWFRIPLLFNLDVGRLALREIAVSEEVLSRLPWDKRVPILSASGVTAVVSHEGPVLPGLRGVASVSNASRRDVFLYRNDAALPHARFFTNVSFVPRATRALAEMLRPGFDPARTLLVEGADGPVTGTPCPVTISSQKLRPEHERLQVESPCAGYLLLLTPFHAGWTATVDGVPATLLRANASFQAVRLGPGPHTLEHRYWPPGLTAGFAVSALAFLGLAGLFGWPWRVPERSGG
jgi:Bacterial membrane protein YfhO